jgi:hypothetical protein
LAEDATALQQRAEQLVVDAPQTADPDEVAKVMQQGSRRQMAAIGQMSEATPSALLGEHLDVRSKNSNQLNCSNLEAHHFLNADTGAGSL